MTEASRDQIETAQHFLKCSGDAIANIRCLVEELEGVFLAEVTGQSAPGRIVTLQKMDFVLQALRAIQDTFSEAASSNLTEPELKAIVSRIPLESLRSTFRACHQKTGEVCKTLPSGESINDMPALLHGQARTETV